MNIAVYPGSFDPVTFGHLDIISRGSRTFDRLIVAVFRNASKTPLFSVDERLDMLRQATEHLKNVEVDASDGLVVDYARRRGARVILKSLRVVSDFEYELMMALMNQKLAGDIETVFMMTSSDHLFLSSSIVRELASLGAPVSDLVPPHVEARLRDRFSRPGRAPGGSKDERPI